MKIKPLNIRFARAKNSVANMNCPCGSTNKFKKCHLETYRNFIKMKDKVIVLPDGSWSFKNVKCVEILKNKIIVDGVIILGKDKYLYQQGLMYIV